jgi:hypothetical protein
MQIIHIKKVGTMTSNNPSTPAEAIATVMTSYGSLHGVFISLETLGSMT